jgi:SHS2 domain-containing protein
MPVDIVDHTADIRLRVHSRSFPLALLELSNYMLGIIFKGDVECTNIIQSSVEFTDKESCVVRFLSDVLYYLDSRNIAMKVRYLKIERGLIRWEACSEKFDYSKHEMGYVIKGATYDRISIDKKNNIIEITLDI